jgi:hypothetical protein
MPPCALAYAVRKLIREQVFRPSRPSFVPHARKFYVSVTMLLTQSLYGPRERWPGCTTNNDIDDSWPF